MSETARDSDEAESGIDFPELRQSKVGRGGLERYFEDLREVAEVDDVRVKGGAAQYADDREVGLERAFELLLEGEVRGVQIRYVWRDEAWWDTLIGGEEGVELTRVQPPEFPDETS